MEVDCGRDFYNRLLFSGKICGGQGRDRGMLSVSLNRIAVDKSYHVIPALHTYFFNKKLRSSLSTESFLTFPLFSIIMRKVAYCIYIVIG